jgi:2-polyprenyl-3-methyl-5-hydroxy-6-metoxy-1,4-benzoquinol methylase
MTRSVETDVNVKLTKYKLDQFTSGHKFRNVKKRHDSLVSFISKYTKDLDSPILDIGCREGLLLDKLDVAGYTNLTGIDISRDAIDLASSRGYMCCVANVMDLSMFESNVYTYVIASHVLEHCSAPDRAIMELKRVMLPKGLLFIEVPLEKELNLKSGHFTLFKNKKDLTDLLAGFTLLGDEIYKRKASPCYRAAVENG